MKIKLPEITQNQYFKTGKWLFFGIGLFQLGNLIILWKGLTFFAIASSFLYLCFSFVTALFFRFLEKQFGSIGNMSKMNSTQEEFMEAFGK